MTLKSFLGRWSAVAVAMARHSRETSSAAAIALAVLAHGPSSAASVQTAGHGDQEELMTGAPSKALDPFERSNRRAFNFEKGLDRAVLRPGSVAYRRILPKAVRSGLAHFASNLSEPEVFANDALQARPANATTSFMRFSLNSTLGVGGLWDVAGRLGLPRHENDFGLTLARYGVAPGPYLFMPLLGPSSVRDASGKALSLAFNPLTYFAFGGSGALAAGDAVASGLDRRGKVDGDLKALNASALDPYAALRSYYLQARESEVRGGVVSVESLPDFGDEASASPAAERSAP